MEEQQKQPLRRKRSDAGKVRISRRTLWLLEWIGDMYALRQDHLEQLLAWEVKRPDKVKQEGKLHSRDLLKRWKEKYRFVDYQVVYSGEPAWIWLTQEGLDAAGLPYKYLEPKPQSDYSHWYYNNLVRMWVQQKRPDRLWLSERRLKYGKDTRKRQRVLDIDAEVQQGEHHAKRIAVEVELTAKDEMRTLNKMRALAHSDYDGTWYFVTSKATKKFASPSRTVVLNAWRRLNVEQQEVIFIFDLDNNFALIEE
jgi:hypothetical protein